MHKAFSRRAAGAGRKVKTGATMVFVAGRDGSTFQLAIDLSRFPAPPTLSAGRFAVRPFQPVDLPVVAEAASDPHIPLITTVPVPFTEQAGLAFLDRQATRLQTDLGYSLAIVDAGNDRAIGQIGLWLRNLDKGRASLGYWVVGSARGHEAARHALGALTRWARRTLAPPRLELYVEPWNHASIRTAEAAGFRREGLLRSWEQVGGTRKDMIMFSLLAEEMPEGPRSLRPGQ